MDNYKRKLAGGILTPRIRQAQFELIQAVGQSLETCGLLRDQAEGKTSALICDVWNEIDVYLKRLPTTKA
jgi:hypothetical protein